MWTHVFKPLLILFFCPATTNTITPKKTLAPLLLLPSTQLPSSSPDSWEVADVDAAMSRLMLSPKRESNNSSPNLTTGSSSEINSDLLAP
ncbi:hypothetical protein Hanom_Chr05g00385711 [Helianthus anomalus]